MKWAMVMEGSRYVGELGCVVETSGNTVKLAILGLGDRKFDRREVIMINPRNHHVYKAWVRDIPEQPILVLGMTQEDAARTAFLKFNTTGLDLELTDGEDLDADILVEDIQDGEGTCPAAAYHVSVRFRLVPDIRTDIVSD